MPKPLKVRSPRQELKRQLAGTSFASAPHNRRSEDVWREVAVNTTLHIHCLRHPMTLTSISRSDLMLRHAPSTQRQGKRKHVSAVVIFAKQFHQFPCWGFTG